MIFYLKSYLNVNYQGKKRTFTLIDIRPPLTNNLLPNDSEFTANEIISYKAKITYKWKIVNTCRWCIKKTFANLVSNIDLNN